MKQLDVIGLGMATVDVLIRLPAMPTWERGGYASDFRLDGGGPVATAMVASARLGAQVGFVGTAGNDAMGEMKLDGLAQEGIDLSRVIRREAPDDQVVIVYVEEETGERTFCGVRRGERVPLTVNDLDRDYITSAQYLHLDGMHATVASIAAQWMHDANKTVLYDGGTTNRPVPERTRRVLEHVDVLICGSGFAQNLTGLSDTWEAAEAALEVGPRIVVQTEGADGSYTVTADDRFHTPAFPIEVIDTTGAGDVFHGAYIVGLLHGWNLRDVARFSAAVSSLKCGKLGGRAGIPTFDETLAFLRDRDIHLEP